MYPKKRVRQIRILPTSSDDYDFEDGGSLVNIYSNKKLIACFCTKKDAVLVFTKIDDNLVTINEK